MPKISRILCPIDFSETSRHALDQAGAIAESYRAGLHVLNVRSPIIGMIPEVLGPGDPERASEFHDARAQAMPLVQPFLAAGVGVEVEVEAGQPAPVILARATGLPADLIVMGTHGASGFEHLLLGSVTEKVLRKATCPVLTVPPRAHATSHFPFRRVLCAVDFSEWSTAALEFAVSVAEESRGALELLHVLEWPWEEPPAPVFEELPAEQAAALTECRRYLEQTATARLDSLLSNGVRDRCRVTVHVVYGKPYVQLLRVAAEIDADLIVLGVHGRNPIDVAMFGSTTNQVVRRATCPVLTLRR